MHPFPCWSQSTCSQMPFPQKSSFTGFSTPTDMFQSPLRPGQSSSRPSPMPPGRLLPHASLKSQTLLSFTCHSLYLQCPPSLAPDKQLIFQAPEEMSPPPRSLPWFPQTSLGHLCSSVHLCPLGFLFPYGLLPVSLRQLVP